jgi:hypothetical protein
MTHQIHNPKLQFAVRLTFPMATHSHAPHFAAVTGEAPHAIDHFTSTSLEQHCNTAPLNHQFWFFGIPSEYEPIAFGLASRGFEGFAQLNYNSD